MAQQRRFQECLKNIKNYTKPITKPGHRPNFGMIKLRFFFLLLQWSTEVSWAQELAGNKYSPYYYVGCFSVRTEVLTESVYAKMPQTCVEICELKNTTYAIMMSEKCYCSSDIVVEDKQDDMLCNTPCVAIKSEYCGGVGVHSYYTFNTDASPKDLKLQNATENSLSIIWTPYKPPKTYIAGSETPSVFKITNYLIQIQRLHTYSSKAFFAQPEFVVQGTENKIEITDLLPATKYNITVRAICEGLAEEADNCGSASIVGTTLVAEPSPQPAQPKILQTTDTTLTIEIKPVRNDNGPVTKVLVIVERIDDSLSQTFDTSLLGSWKKADEDGLPYYIAAELDYDRPGDNKTRKFIVGDGKRYGRYTNPPLDNKNSDFHVSLGVVSTLNGITKTLYTRSSHDQHTTSMDNFTYATFEAGQSSVVALIVTCSIFGICFILSVITYFYLRYKQCQIRSGRGNSHEMTMQQPIIERENNGYIVEDEMPPTVENFKEQLNALVDKLDVTKKIPRNNLRMNVNDIIAEGNYGEVITGKLLTNNLPESSADCQLHVLSLDELTSTDQGKLLQEFRNLTKLQQHSNLLDFYGVSSSTDWFYLVFEHENVTLKRRLIESRRAPSSAIMQRITALSEQLILQWIYEIASAMDYLAKSKVIHKHLSSHCIYVTAEMKLKVSVFGPTAYVNNQKKIDLTRWLAPEVLRYQHYSSKSDVWSFAVVAWECCSLGATPYAQINNSNKVLDALKSGSRPAQPAFVYEDLYQMLLNCWTLEPSERINFEDIAFNVRQLMTSPRHALNFDAPKEQAANDVLNSLPFYLPMLEMEN
ncbi:putative tyrosine-protein kinase Wsck [Lucilia cuprina]|uniref:putative tyrosine-protein kinase Wsck n=1 Tax=Lucilia cuprina TaxID=7375 RepID=UPI001F060EC5|nr:putative tyrosine-protein kinase Wsck [Lucilia cuprina]